MVNWKEIFRDVVQEVRDLPAGCKPHYPLALQLYDSVFAVRMIIKSSRNFSTASSSLKPAISQIKP